MNIDTKTTQVLKNFAKINPSIVFKEGNVVKVISPTKTIMAKATVPTTFDRRFAIYNLDRFLSAVSLFTNPDLSFGEKSVTISEDHRVTKYSYADESTFIKVPEKDIELPSVDVSFRLSNTALKEVEKALGVLGLPEIVVRGENGKMLLQASDTKSPNDVYSVELGETDKTFCAVFKTENIKILPGDYDVSICSRGISHFKGEDIEYWIAVEQHSTFG